MSGVNKDIFRNHCCSEREETLTFSNCTRVAGSIPPTNENTILHIDDEIKAVVAFSLENTGRNNIILTITFSDGDAPFGPTTVEVGSSFAGVFANVREITIRSTAPDLPITGTFKYQITYTFDV